MGEPQIMSFSSYFDLSPDAQLKLCAAVAAVLLLHLVLARRARLTFEDVDDDERDDAADDGVGEAHQTRKDDDETYASATHSDAPHVPFRLPPVTPGAELLRSCTRLLSKGSRSPASAASRNAVACR